MFKEWKSGINFTLSHNMQYIEKHSDLKKNFVEVETITAHPNERVDIRIVEMGPGVQARQCSSGNVLNML